jgi:hypothetical protein
MSGASADQGSDDGAESDLQLALYERFTERAAAERRWQFVRLAAGHAVVGTIVAYAVLFDAPRYVALAPILYGIVVLDALKYSVRRLYLQERLADLETELAAREPLATWVTDHGFFGRADTVEWAGIDLDRVPELAQYALVGAIYLGLVAVGLVAWRPLPADGAVLPVTRGLLAVSYGTFTLLVLGIVLVARVHYHRVRRRFADMD